MSLRIASDLAARASEDVLFLPGIADTVAKNNMLIGRIIPNKGYHPGATMMQTVITGSPTAEFYVENQSLPVRTKSTEIEVTHTFRAYRTVIGMSSHAKRRIGANGAGLKPGQPGAELDLQQGMMSVTDLETTDYLARQIYGLQGLIDDSTTNFGNQSRTTYTTLVSYLLNASSAALSTSLINKASWRSREFPYQANVQLWLACPARIGDYAELVSGKAALANVARGDIVPMANGFMQVGTNVFAEMPDLTTSVMLGLTNVDSDWGYYSNEVTDDGMSPAPGGYRLKEFYPDDDSDMLQISKSSLILCRSPHKQIKIYGLSTS